MCRVGNASNGSLEGIVVLDLASLITGPYCASLLGDLGAEVIKIEHPRGGDPLRQLGTPVAGGSALFLSINRNKQGVTLDLNHSEGMAILDRLIDAADVLIENFRPDIKKKYHLTYKELHSRKPGLICLSITGFGEEGPYALKPGTDHIFQAMSGIMTVSGDAGRGPLRIGVPVADMTAALYAAFGVMSALFIRQRNGKGQQLCINLLDAAMCMQTTQAGEYFITGKEPVQNGNDSPFAYPVGVFRTADGHISISAFNDKFWQGLCRALSLEDWLQDKRFADEQQRFACKDILKPVLEDCFLRKTTADWLTALEREDVPCGPVHGYDDLFADPQVVLNGLTRTLPHPLLKQVRILGNPLRFSENPAREQAAAPLFGGDTDAILYRLGYSAREIAAFRQRGVI